MDCIKIKNLEIFGNHGVYKEENTLGQKFIICAELYLNIRSAGLSDDIDQTIHYGEVCKFIDSFMREKTYYLVEAVAEELARRLLLKYEILNGVEIEIKKPWAPIGLPIEEVSVTISRGWHDAYIALGSNIGDSKSYIEGALQHMNDDDDIKVLEVSSLIKTKPYGYEEQDDFLNGAVHIRTLYTPNELLRCLNQMEGMAGRERKIHWGPRTLDLDILLYDDLVIDSPDLKIPHPEMHIRDFVLKPLNEIAPWLRHPLTGRTIKEHLDEVSLLTT